MSEDMRYCHVSFCLLTVGDEIQTEFSALTGITHLILLHSPKTPFLAFQETLKVISLLCWTLT